MLALSLVALLATAAASLDSWAAYCNQRIASPNGRYYAVIRSENGTGLGGASYDYASVPDDAPPVEDAVAPNPYEQKLSAADERALLGPRDRPAGA